VAAEKNVERRGVAAKSELGRTEPVVGDFFGVSKVLSLWRVPNLIPKAPSTTST
jgi:hypothetical protein